MFKLVERKSFRIVMDSRGSDGAIGMTVSGKIHEEFGADVADEALESLVGLANKPVELQLGDVASINSVGIRNWILFVETLEKSHQLRFSEIGEVFVEAAILIPTLFGNPENKVLAMRLPYHCPGCGRDCALRFVRSEMISANGEFQVPRRFCEACGGSLEFGAIEEEYALFVRQRT